MAVGAIDQGTTSTKAVLLEAGLATEVVDQLGHEQRYPADGWVEHDPEELVGNVRAGLERLAARAPLESVGVANQGETVVAWDADSGRPVYPAIVWQDNRTHGRIEELKAEGVEELTLARAGLPLDPYFSASKLAWIVENVPEAQALARTGRLRLGTTDAFFLDRLCGVFATDVSTASRTSLLDIRNHRWDPELCEVFGVPIEALPEIRPTVGDFGEVDLGGRKVGVRASVVDQQAALYGHGCRQQGDAKITFGTGAFVLAVSGAGFPEGVTGGILPTIAWQIGREDPVYALDGGVYDAGSALDWARGVGLFSEYRELEDLPEEPAISRGLAFVPALSGLACPYWDRTAAGTWLGVTHRTSPLDLAQAVLEGVALLTTEVLSAMEPWSPGGGPVSIDGGLARSSWFCRFLATILGREIRVPAVTELTAFGAGLLAAEVRERPVLEAATFSPGEGEPQAWREIFAEAVGRSRHWRR